MTTVSLGTRAQATAVTILAPCLAMPPASYARPTMKPVMFCRNSSGVRRWSQSSMKWAPFSADSQKSTPLLASDPDRVPVDPGEGGDQGGAVLRLELLELAAVGERADHVAHVVGRARVRRHDAVQVRAAAGGAGWTLPSATAGAPSARAPATMVRTMSRACASSSARWSTTPDLRACTSPPPRSSALTISPVAAFTRGGPPRKIVP